MSLSMSVRSVNKVILDVSPAVINRTAVYHMVIDLGERLTSDYNTELSIVGKNIAKNQSPAFLRNLDLKKKKNLKRIVSKHVSNSFMRPLAYFSHNRPVPSGSRRLFFDALYVPFSGLSSRDSVIVHDLTTLTFPDWHGAKVSEVYSKAFARISSSGCHIISDSDSTTSELRYHFGISPDRINTIPLYLRKDQSNSPSIPVPSRGDKFFLFVGSLERRKNLTGLIRAFEMTGLANEGYSLKIVGMDGNGAGEIRELSRKVVGVELLGFVDEKTLVELYANCRAFVYPSFWEGFGMPLLEAMAQGCVCVSTQSGASPEVGGDSVLYVDPCSIDSIAAGILTVERMSLVARSTMKELAYKRSKLFTFEEYYKKVEEVLLSRP
jgi:glycosyltransferase involved in cell wall biosynthesis